MSIRDPELERQRLRAFYKKLTDGELEKLAADEASLTDEARQVLKYELALRTLDRGDILAVFAQSSADGRLTPATTQGRMFASADEDDDEADSEEEDLEPSPGKDSSDAGPALLTIRRFRDLPEALLAKGRLNSDGIECYLMDDNMVRLDWFYSNLVGGVKLQVKPEDVEISNEILNQPIPEEFEVEGLGEYEQPRCPTCQSLDVVFEELNKPIAYGSAFLTLPLPIHNRGWKCHTCGAQWEDADQAAEE